MAGVTVAQWIYYGLLATGTAVQVKSSRNAAKAQEIQYNEQAKDEQAGARDREIERKRRLISSLSAQAAEAGTAGIDPTVGTRKAIAMEDVRLAGFDSQTDSSRTNRRSLLLKSSGKQARTQGNLQAAGAVLNAGGRVLSRYERDN